MGELSWALKNLQTYCRNNNLGFIEASDIVVPHSDEVYGNLHNLRAQFLA